MALRVFAAHPRRAVPAIAVYEHRPLRAALGTCRGRRRHDHRRRRALWPCGWLLEIYRKKSRYLPAPTCTACCTAYFATCGNGQDGRRLLDLQPAGGYGRYMLDAWRCATPRGHRPVGYGEQACAALSARCRVMSAGPLCRALLALYGAEPARLAKLHQEFYCDSHAYWPADPDAPRRRQPAKTGSSWAARPNWTSSRPEQQAGSDAGAEALLAQVRGRANAASLPGFFAQVCHFAGGAAP